MKLFFKEGGSGDRLYLLIHGLGCTSEVWRGFTQIIEKQTTGRWIAPDLRGHGRSPWSATYAIGHHAADVAALIQDEENITIVGHSMGALIGIVLATGIFGIRPSSTLGVGLKCDWPEDERDKLVEFAGRPTRWFENEKDAIERYLRVSGLEGLVDPASSDLKPSIFRGEGGFRLAADPKTVTVGGPPDGIFDCARNTTPIRLACGEHDTVTHIEGLKKMDPEAIQIRGLGHNCHVEDPETLWHLVNEFDATT